VRKWLWGAATLVALIAAAFAVSPWPSVMIIRAIFDRGATEASRKLEARVPNTVSTSTYEYDVSDSAASLDIHRPAVLAENGPVVVWIHGGGFVSGQRHDITNYAKILAAEGFVVVNMDYTIAPEAIYPGPVRQVLAALAFLEREQEKLGLPSGMFVLAGDSAGAQLAAQAAAVITNAEYARRVGLEPRIEPDRIVGALLHCGVYDIGGMGRDGGVLAWFVGAAGWAYSGKRDWRADPYFKTMSVSEHVTPAFPATFISAGNADPLGPQSIALATRLKQVGVPTETLFFPPGYTPPLGHEYQFDLQTEAAKLALSRTAAWLRQL